MLSRQNMNSSGKVPLTNKKDKDERNLHHLTEGSVVWVLCSKRERFPALIISEKLTYGRLIPSPTEMLVFWLSTFDVSKVSKDKILPFSAGFERFTKRMTRELDYAVRTALYVLAERCEPSLDLCKYECLIDWAKDDNGYLFLAENTPQLFYPKPDAPVPNFVMNCIENFHLKDDCIRGRILTWDKPDSELGGDVEVDNVVSDRGEGDARIMEDTVTGTYPLQDVDMGGIARLEIRTDDGSDCIGECLRSTAMDVEETDKTLSHHERQVSEKSQLNRFDCQINDTNTNNLSVEHLCVGSVVWATFGKKSVWPAIVISEDMTDESISTSPDLVLVFWLSSLDITQVKKEKVMPFSHNFLRYFNKKGTSMRQAVLRALHILADRIEAGVTEDECLMDWALADKGYLYRAKTDPEIFYPNPDAPVPSFVLDCLQHLFMKDDLNKADAPDVTEMDRFEDFIMADCRGDTSTVNISEEIWDSGKLVNKIHCIACLQSITDLSTNKNHPLFEGQTCKECAMDIQDGLFGTDVDGSGAFCVVCGRGGQLVECDTCRRAYCYQCLIRHVGRSLLKMILGSETWHCFCCSPYMRDTHGNLKMREDSRLEVIRLADENYQDLPHGLKNFLTTEKRPLRVLSLFDGIGTGKYVLDSLGFAVEKYFASEIDPSAQLVALSLGNIEIVGNVKDLNEHKLKQMCPIDLLIGGPPCNDLSIVNPLRCGFDSKGTGQLVWEFIRIYHTLQHLCQHTNHIFFLMESTGHMPVEYKEVISNRLMREPAVWDSAYFTGMKRRRYFWGNIPGLKCPPSFLNHITKDRKTLQDALSYQVGRQASVDITRTLTTNLNSHTVRNQEPASVVTQNGEDSTLLSCEMERLFGFYGHYTDVGRLNRQNRRELLGRSWCVPVIKQILSPLKEYYLTRSD